MDFEDAITAIELHAGGEPGRVVVGGIPHVPGATMFAKREHFARHLDHLRLRLLREPRGYPALCCNVLLPPTLAEADAGFIVLEQSEYPAMSGSNTICVATALIETGLVDVTEPVTVLALETPAGLVRVRAEVEGGRCRSVTFENVPAFVAHLDAVLDVPGIGDVVVDVAWGGMWYVIADADALGVALERDAAHAIASIGERLRAAAAEQLPAVHPQNPALAGVSIAQLSGAAREPGVTRRNAVVLSAGGFDAARPETWRGVLDRSPCGTGTCAKMAALHARGALAIGEPFVHQGILDTVFTGRLLGETRVGGVPAVVPEITGSAWIYGRSQFVVADDDPFADGFTVADIWPHGR